MSNGQEKVYCKDCLFFVEGERIPYSYGPPEYIKERCLSPSNFKDTHKTPTRLPVSQPRVINRFNDCTWYEPIPDEGSSSSGSSSSSSS